MSSLVFGSPTTGDIVVGNAAIIVTFGVTLWMDAILALVVA